MSLSINKHFSVPQLRSPDNYHDWLVALTTFLEAHDLWDYICYIPPLPVGTSAAPASGQISKGEKGAQKFESTQESSSTRTLPQDDAIAEALEISVAKLRSKRAKARGFILATLAPSVQASLQTIRDPRKVLESLRDRYLPRNRMRLFKVTRELMNLHLQPREELDHYFHRLDSLVDELNAHQDFAPPTGTIIAATLAGLPQEYRVYTDHVEHTQEDLDLTTIRNGLRHEEIRIREAPTIRKEAVLISESKISSNNDRTPKAKHDGGSEKSSKTCTFCKRPGHSAVDCRRQLGQIKKLEEAAYITSTTPVSQGATISSESEDQTVETFYALMARTNDSPASLEHDTWYLDTGATAHFTCNRDWLHDFVEIPPHPVILGNNRVEHATGRGTILATTLADSVSRRIKLEKVLYVPTFGKNLVSAQGMLCGNRYGMLRSDRCLIFDQALGQVVLEATPASSGLLVVPLNVIPPRRSLTVDHAYTTQEVTPDINELHRRFGHVGEEKIRTLAKWLGISLVGQTLDQCSTCVRKKQKRPPIRDGPAPRARLAMEVLHLDLGGPISPPTYNGCRYYLAIVDSHSRWAKTYLLRTKDATVDAIRNFLATAPADKQCRRVVTDQGGEFASLAVQELLHTAGIEHHTTPVRTPEYNGLVERFNQTVMNSVRCLLDTAQIGHEWWGEALSMATLLYNATPHRANENKSPVELWTGTPPRLHHLRTFGCRATVLINPALRGKLDSRSQDAIYLGPARGEASHHRLLLIDTERIVESRDVVFISPAPSRPIRQVNEFSDEEPLRDDFEDGDDQAHDRDFKAPSGSDSDEDYSNDESTGNLEEAQHPWTTFVPRAPYNSCRPTLTPCDYRAHLGSYHGIPAPYHRHRSHYAAHDHCRYHRTGLAPRSCRSCLSSRHVAYDRCRSHRTGLAPRSCRPCLSSRHAAHDRCRSHHTSLAPCWCRSCLSSRHVADDNCHSCRTGLAPHNCRSCLSSRYAAHDHCHSRRTGLAPRSCRSYLYTRHAALGRRASCCVLAPCLGYFSSCSAPHAHQRLRTRCVPSYVCSPCDRRIHPAPRLYARSRTRPADYFDRGQRSPSYRNTSAGHQLARRVQDPAHPPQPSALARRTGGHIDDDDRILSISGEPFIDHALITAHLLDRITAYTIDPVDEEGREQDYVNLTSNSHFTPSNYREATSCANATEWRKAMDEEIENLRQNRTWELVPRSPAMRIVKTMFIFKLKVHADGSIERYKARFVAKGFTQTWNVDYHETFAPVISIDNYRLLLAFAVAHDLEIHQMDVEAAFLHAPLSEVVYVAQPEGYVDPERPHHVCRLAKSLYGLKQAPFEWNRAIDDHLQANNFLPLDADACIYVRRTQGHIAIIALYVDDCTILAHRRLLQSTKDILISKFKMKDLGEARSVLGMEIIRHRSAGQLRIRMSGYSNEILACFDMTKCRPSTTPMTAGLSLPRLEQTPGDARNLPYRNAVGRLLYLARVGRPDMLYAVHYLTHFVNGYDSRHWKAVKHVLRYLRGTTNYSILYDRRFSSPREPLSLIPRISCDTNFGPSNVDSRKSLSAVEVRLCGGVISWFVKTQDCVALSTMESELNAISVAVCQALYLRKLLRPLGITTAEPIPIVNDNQSAIAIISSRRSNYIGNQKHYDIKVKHAHDTLQAGLVSLSYCPTTELPADLLTKALARVRFNELKEKLGLHSYDEQD